MGITFVWPCTPRQSCARNLQAYIEETPPEELHLCRDSNRLDESQLGIIRSPEGALWKEVVGFAPPYEMKQSTRVR